MLDDMFEPTRRRAILQPSSANRVTLETCRSWSSTTSRRCATRSSARCGSRATRSSSPPTAPRRSTRSATDSPDAVVLDLMMPRRRRARGVPPDARGGRPHAGAVLTARDAVSDRVAGPRRRRRRLPRQAVRARRAARAAARAAAPLGRERRRAGAALRRPELDPVVAPGEARRPRDRADAHRVPAARAVPAPSAPGADPAR